MLPASVQAATSSIDRRKAVASSIGRREAAAADTADGISPVIAAPVGGFELTGAIGGWIKPRLAPEHPGCGEFEPRFPSCRSGLCDPLFCMCKCAAGPEATHPPSVQSKGGLPRIFAGSDSREEFMTGRLPFQPADLRRVRFDPDIEGRDYHEPECRDPQPTVVLGPCGERHAVDRRALDVEPARCRHSPEIRHAAKPTSSSSIAERRAARKRSRNVS